MPIPTHLSTPGAKAGAGAPPGGGSLDFKSCGAQLDRIQRDKPRRKAGLKPGKLSATHVDINTQLLDAIQQEKPRVVRRLLDSEANPNTQGAQSQTPLILACTIQDKMVRKTTIDLLLKKGADVNSQDITGQSAMIKAVLLDDIATFSTLLEHDCDVSLVDCDGNNALCYAAMQGNNNIVRKLVHESLRKKLEIDHQNMRGLTALLIACQKGHLETARILAIEGGASVTIRDLENFMNAHEWMKATGFYMPQELTFLSPSRKRRNYYREQRQKKGIKTLMDYLPTRDHLDDCESPNVFRMRRKSLEEDKFVLPTLSDLNPTKSALPSPGSTSMFNLPKRSMFDVPESTSASSLSAPTPTRSRPASIPDIPFSTIKTDVYHSSYLDRRKSLLRKTIRVITIIVVH